MYLIHLYFTISFFFPLFLALELVSELKTKNKKTTLPLTVLCSFIEMKFVLCVEVISYNIAKLMYYTIVVLYN